MPIRMTPLNMRNRESGKSLIIINNGTLQPKMIIIAETILRIILLSFLLFSELLFCLNWKLLDNCIFAMDNYLSPLGKEIIYIITEIPQKSISHFASIFIRNYFTE